MSFADQQSGADDDDRGRHDGAVGLGVRVSLHHVGNVRHRVHAGRHLGFRSGSGMTFSHTFSQAGTFPYFCRCTAR